jgi:hypothetical protein
MIFCKKTIALTLTFFIFSCATTQVIVEPFDTSKTYMSSYDDSWKKLVRFFSTNQIGIGTLEKDSGIITVNNQNLSQSLTSEYCAVSVPFLWTHTGGQAVGSATLVEDDNFVTANVNIQFSANFSSCDLYGRCNYQTNPCPSNGTFERALLSSLD